MKLSSCHSIRLVALGALAPVMASVLGGAGCSDDVASTDATDGGSFEERDATTDTCGACVADQCTAAWALCLTDDGCLEARACVSRGSNASACICRTTGDGGTSAEGLYRAFAACNDARTCAGCATDCAIRCGAQAPTLPPPCDHVADASSTDADGGDAGEADAADAGEALEPSADGCTSCAASRCDGAKNACPIGSECAAFLECAFACNDTDCAAACGVSHATGKVAAIELATCARSSCAAECGL